MQKMLGKIYGMEKLPFQDLLRFPCYLTKSSLVAQTVKRLPAMWETWVWSWGQEDPLEKEMATHSSTLAWKIHGWRSLAGYSPWGLKELDTTEQLHFYFPTGRIPYVLVFLAQSTVCLFSGLTNNSSLSFWKCINLNDKICGYLTNRTLAP